MPKIISDVRRLLYLVCSKNGPPPSCVSEGRRIMVKPVHINIHTLILLKIRDKKNIDFFLLFVYCNKKILRTMMIFITFISVALPTQKQKIFLLIVFTSKNFTALALVKMIPLRFEKLTSLLLTCSIFNKGRCET